MDLWRSLMPRSSAQHQTPQAFPLALLLVTPCMEALHQPPFPSTRMCHHQTSPLQRCAAAPVSVITCSSHLHLLCTAQFATFR